MMSYDQNWQMSQAHSLDIDHERRITRLEGKYDSIEMTMQTAMTWVRRIAILIGLSGSAAATHWDADTLARGVVTIIKSL